MPVWKKQMINVPAQEGQYRQNRQGNQELEHGFRKEHPWTGALVHFIYLPTEMLTR